ncbi:hypothetical protein [Clostridium butyricum]|uniref:hypothetical protein n=1 Tax=Clostridium butyricum TaxID=1492 RepID=UPI0034668767
MITNEEYLMKHVRKAERDLRRVVNQKDKFIDIEKIKFTINNQKGNKHNNVVYVNSNYFKKKSSRNYNKKLLAKLHSEMLCIFVRDKFTGEEFGFEANTSPVFIGLAEWINSRNDENVFLEINEKVKRNFKEYNTNLYEIITDELTDFTFALIHLNILAYKLSIELYKIKDKVINSRYSNVIRKCELVFSDDNLCTNCSTTYSQLVGNNCFVERVDKINLGLDFASDSKENKLSVESIISILCDLNDGNYQKIA